jgi:hypothetical protein
MLQSISQRAPEIDLQTARTALPVLRWALTTPHGRLNPKAEDTSFPDWSSTSTMRQSVKAKVAALRTWVSGAVGYERHQSTLWAQDQQDALARSTLSVQESFHNDGLAGLADQLMAYDPLEKQVLLQRLINKIKPSDQRRQPLVEFARATAQLEKNTLDFLDHSAESFTAFNHVVVDGARLLRGIVYELGESSQQGDITAISLARSILGKLHDMLFEEALQVIRQGIRADLRSGNPSPMSMKLLAALSQKAVFPPVKLSVRISGDLCARLRKLGIKGHFSKEDLARALLVGAESGSTELTYLLQRYLGPDFKESVCINPQALMEFKNAVQTLPITLWPAAWVHRRDRLLNNIDGHLAKVLE